MSLSFLFKKFAEGISHMYRIDLSFDGHRTQTFCDFIIRISIFVTFSFVSFVQNR